MSVKILIDMNLSPGWVPVFQAAGMPAVHWSEAGNPKADDRTVMAWAEANGHVVFTHDLDFGAILACNRKDGPSVLQIRGQDVMPDSMGNLVVAAIRQHEADLASGALVVVDAEKSRVRILPI